MATSKIQGQPKDNQINVRLNDAAYKKLKFISDSTGYNQSDTIVFCINMTNLAVKDKAENDTEFDRDLDVRLLRRLYIGNEEKSIKKDLPSENRSTV